MDLKTLHLEEAVVFPENLSEKIFDKNVIAVFDTDEFDTPEQDELNEQGFWGTRGEDDRLHVYFSGDYDIGPFGVSVTPNYDDDSDKVLKYKLRFYFSRYIFTPLYKYVDEWGRQNRKGSISLTGNFVELLDDVYLSDYNGGLEITTNTYDDEIEFETRDQAVFMKMLAELSAAFRTLAAEHGSSGKDSYDNYGYAAIQRYKEKDFDGIAYGDLVEGALVPVLTAGLDQGLEEFRVNRDQDASHHVISIAIDPKRKRMMFYDGGECKGKAFFEFELGALVPKCISLIENEGLSYAGEAANWFKEAIQNVQNIYKKLGITVKTPEAGNPVLEHFE